MPHDHHHHSHPERFSDLTFDEDEVGRELEAFIARARRVENLRTSDNRAHIEMLDIPVEPATITQVVRKDQKVFGDDATAFKNAVTKLIQDGTYSAFISIHADMSHNMHGRLPPNSLRFLPWHRRLLWAFEQALQEADRLLRPQADTPVSIPYWRWVDPFPEWLTDFLPGPHPVTGEPLPPRTLAPPALKPTADDVDTIINRFEERYQNYDWDGYSRFTYGLQGFGTRPDTSNILAHNQVHVWIGGIMDCIRYSPTDPVFWLHHAEVDRLWHIWQLRYPDFHPALTGNDRIMGPHPEKSYDQLSSIAALGYSYESDLP